MTALADRFVLSPSGHIVSMVNPPDNPKAGRQVLPDQPAPAHDPDDPQQWLASAAEVLASWWDDCVASLMDAPGSHVLDR